MKKKRRKSRPGACGRAHWSSQRERRREEEHLGCSLSCSCFRWQLQPLSSLNWSLWAESLQLEASVALRTQDRHQLRLLLVYGSLFSWSTSLPPASSPSSSSSSFPNFTLCVVPFPSIHFSPSIGSNSNQQFKATFYQRETFDRWNEEKKESSTWFWVSVATCIITSVAHSHSSVSLSLTRILCLSLSFSLSSSLFAFSQRSYHQTHLTVNLTLHLHP